MVASCPGTRAPGLSTTNAGSDSGAWLAFEHLVRPGHRRIGSLDAGRIGDVKPRRSAYRRFVREHGLTCLARYQQVVPSEPAGEQAACARLLRLPESPCAIFATTDVLVIGALEGADAAGFRVPQHLSAVGFDDILFAAFTVPALTTVRQSIEAVARPGVEMVLRRAANPGAQPETTGWSRSLSCATPGRLRRVERRGRKRN